MNRRSGASEGGLPRLLLLAWLMLVLSLTGCSSDDEGKMSDEELRLLATGKTPANYEPGELVPMRVGLLNYTDEFMGDVYVDRSWAADSHKHSYTTGAGSAMTPAFYDPNYKVKIVWQPESLYLKDKDAYLEREVVPEPPKKDDLGRMTYLWVTFFPNGEVKLYPTWVEPGNPDFPDGLRDPQKVCVEQFPEDRGRCFPPIPSWHKNRDDKKKDDSPISEQEAQES